jgi:DNA-binding NarL/FixJ family response regulator
MLVEFNLHSENGSYPRTGNGLRFVSQVRTSDTPVRILMFTVMEGEFYETVSLEAGADGFFSKIAPMSRLFTWLNSQL